MNKKIVMSIITVFILFTAMMATSCSHRKKDDEVIQTSPQIVIVEVEEDKTVDGLEIWDDEENQSEDDDKITSTKNSGSINTASQDAGKNNSGEIKSNTGNNNTSNGNVTNGNTTNGNINNENTNSGNNNDENTGNEDINDENIYSYKNYLNMSPSEQQAFYNSFESEDAFFAWYDAAKNEYDANKEEIKIEGGSVDLGDIIGK